MSRIDGDHPSDPSEASEASEASDPHRSCTRAPVHLCTVYRYRCTPPGAVSRLGRRLTPPPPARDERSSTDWERNAEGHPWCPLYWEEEWQCDTHRHERHGAPSGGASSYWTSSRAHSWNAPLKGRLAGQEVASRSGFSIVAARYLLAVKTVKPRLQGGATVLRGASSSSSVEHR